MPEEIITPQERKLGSAIWKTRKRVVLGTLIFCGFCVIYIMLQTNIIPVFDTIVNGCITLAGLALGFFIGGQTYHDIRSEAIESKRKVVNKVVNTILPTEDES